LFVITGDHYNWVDLCSKSSSETEIFVPYDRVFVITKFYWIAQTNKMQNMHVETVCRIPVSSTIIGLYNVYHTDNVRQALKCLLSI
jgi:hypothetical protein